jgi:rhodanese-related sulfurtransferase
MTRTTPRGSTSPSRRPSNPESGPRQGASAGSGMGIRILLGIALLGAVGAGLWFGLGREDGPVKELDNRALARLVASGVQVVDIREPWEWQQTGVIEGSALITAFDAQGRIEPDFATRLAEVVRPDEPFVLVCRTGSRSGVLGPLLAAQLGYSGVHNATNGILSWLQSGGQVVACRLEDGVPTC